MKFSYVSFCFFLIAVCFLCGCSDQDDSISDDVVIVDNVSFEMISIQGDGSFGVDECKLRGVEDKVVMITSKYCGACKRTLPEFLEACDEMGVEPMVLDITIDSDKGMIMSFGVEAHVTPTFLFGCNYYIGSVPKEVYTERLENFLLGD